MVELICFEEASLEPNERATDAEKNDIQALKSDFDVVRRSKKKKKKTVFVVVSLWTDLFVSVLPLCRFARFFVMP